MTNNKAMPVPDMSGSTGSQLEADTSQVLLEARPLHGLHLVSVIEGLAATNTKSFGGDVPAALIAAAARQMAHECSDLKIENRGLTDRVESLRDTLETSRTRNAVFSERIRSEGKNKHLRNLAITVGTSLIGVGIALSRPGSDAYSISALVFGVLLLVLGWFSGPKEETA